VLVLKRFFLFGYLTLRWGKGSFFDLDA